MIARTFLTAVVAATLILSGFLFTRWSERADAFAGRSQAVDATATLTPPPGPDTPTPRSTATPVDSVYAPIVFDTASTPTFTPTTTSPNVTPTCSPTITIPAPVAGSDGSNILSEAAPACGLGPTVTPGATPTIWLTHTPPPP